MKAALRALCVATLLLFAMPAWASYKYVYAGSGRPGDLNQSHIYDNIQSCLGYDFDTEANRQQCVLSRAAWPEGTVINTTTISGFYHLNVVGECVSRSSNVDANLVATGETFIFVHYSGHFIYFRTNVSVRINGVESLAYDDAQCKTRRTIDTQPYFQMIPSSDSKPGANEPDGPPAECRVPIFYKNFFKGRTWDESKGYLVLPKGTKGQWEIASAITVAAYQGDGVTTPGMLTTATYSEPGASPVVSCTFRRNRILYDYENVSRIEEIEVWDHDPRGTLQKPKTKIPAVKSRTTVSKPLVPNGTTPAPGTKVAYAQTSYCKAVRASGGKMTAEPSCAEANGNEVAVQAEVDLTNSPLPYVHPAPEYLKRDNPECAGKYDPKCAWKQSDTPIDPQTQKKEDLVRLTDKDNGQTITKNVGYNNTIYPPSMVAAGTAPSGPTGSDNNPLPGKDDAGNPDSEDGDGDGESAKDAKRFMDCYNDAESEACQDVTSESEANGVGKDAIDGAMSGTLGEPSGIGKELVHKAVAAGTCDETKTSSYCTMVAAMGNLTDRDVPLADLVLWDEEIDTPTGPQPWRIVIPSWVMASMMLMFMIIRYWVGFWILLTGRFSGGDSD